jgi:hypothetical protein
MSGILAPSAHNYVVGKGFIIFTPSGSAQGYHLGNCPKMVYTPKVTVLPHFSSMAGTKVQDFSIISQKGGEVAIDMEEMTAFNMSLFFNGDIDTSDPDNVSVGIFSKNGQIEGRVQFYATNDVGPRWYFDLTRVLLNPTGNFNPISDAYNAMTVNATHVIDQYGLFGTIKLKPDVSLLAPENVLLPFIEGPLKVGDIPAFAKVGEVMTIEVGAWIGAQKFAFQWKADAVNITNQTGGTYTPVVGDVGKVLTCQVTASNLIGSTVALSTATLPVHA